MSICEPCRQAGALLTSGTSTANSVRSLHDKCAGGTWCYCQHQSDHSVLRADRKADPRRGG